ncbi:MAG: PhzF family phenazine biosynthesis protein [Actinomycetota bacterium]
MNDHLLISVFGDDAGGGNPLATFPDGAAMSVDRMQAIAFELGLSETTFVTRCESTSYDVRIFTPREEVPFAGHPTLGTAWALHHLGRLEGDAYTQRSAAGATEVWREEGLMWLRRTGESSEDVHRRRPEVADEIADALGLEPRDVGLEARELGRPGLLRPAFATAGLEHFCVPLRDLDALARVQVRPARLQALSSLGAYCFTAERAGEVRARAFFPGYGIAEDPATGSGAASLGVYLADRVGAISFQIRQGVEMGAASRLFIKATPNDVSVGGRCSLLSD